jgi:hypothetical protein
MSNFKERQASAKKVVQLQNELLALKLKFSANQKQAEPCEDCDALRSEIQKLLDSKKESLEELAILKADFKKVRSENTRLKKKLKDVKDTPQVSSDV